jgi:ribonuclease R
MKKAKYSVNHVQHFGLGLQTYTHFTSPIRRLCDLIVHLQLKQYIFKVETPYMVSLQNIFELAGIATEKEALADDSERAMETKIIATFMKRHIGKTYSAIINSLTHHSIFIELDDIPVRGVIKLSQLNDDYYAFDDRRYLIKGKRRGRTFKLCDSIEVILSSVTDEIIFVPTNLKSQIGKKEKGKKRLSNSRG